jgi:iron complex outermembrane receptor protein
MKRLIILFQLLPALVFAQNIKGTVTDSSGAAIHNAAVSVNGQIVAYTASDGSFEIQPPEKGAIIRISHLAFVPFETEYDGSESVLKIVLKTRQYSYGEVVISSTRADRESAVAFINLDKQEIEKNNTGKDLPFIIEMTPSVTATSDAGHGIGYTGLWIRGSDPSRINVTINGIPLNDSESQLVFWVDLPDLSSSVDNLQIQRGAGTSTNGAGAFGGSIHLQTNKRNDKPYGMVTSSAGSFGTVKNTFLGGTGLINNHFTFDVRLSAIRSDGYIDRASANLKSVYVAHGYHGKNTSVIFNLFSGKEITYQSWYGTPESRIKNDIQGMKDFVIRNGLDSQDSLNLLTAGRTYNFYTYQNQVDDYKQDHYQLHVTHRFGTKVYGSLGLHFTKGAGFFEEYKKNSSLSKYGIDDSLTQSIFQEVNLIRRRWLDNDFYGLIYALNYTPSASLKLTWGGAWNQYDGDHFGELIWATYLPAGIPYRYYFNNGFKTDFNTFLKSVWNTGALSLYADIQIRRTGYHFSIPDEKGNPASVDFDENIFFNPKAGISYQLNQKQRIYASVTRAGKEPSRKDYIDNPRSQRPKAERMTDVEAGYEIMHEMFQTSLNFYHMQYDNQLALNGSLNDVGEPVRVNVKDSYRQGVEFIASFRPRNWLRTTGNITLSRNRIKLFQEITPDYDDFSQDTLLFRNTPLSFSPPAIMALSCEMIPLKNLSFGIQFKYVAKQYLDNTGNEMRKLNPYHFFNAHAGYLIQLNRKHELHLRCSVYNLTNRLYETNGYTYSYIYAGERITENFYYPQAGRHWIFSAGLKF